METGIAEVDLANHHSLAPNERGLWGSPKNYAKLRARRRTHADTQTHLGTYTFIIYGRGIRNGAGAVASVLANSSSGGLAVAKASIATFRKQRAVSANSERPRAAHSY